MNKKISKFHTTLNIGLFGAGTVGGGVLEILAKRQKILQAQGFNLQVKKCCIRDLPKYKNVISSDIEIVTDIDDIINDEHINCVIELIGGTDDAKDIVFSAIQKGKHVITANKALIGKYFLELEALLAKNKHVYFGYEAAVGGGIPIIQALKQNFKIDKPNEIYGIMNGTTNFILSKMELGSGYEETLKEAQTLGYAEADPTADVGGFDARSKLAILIRLAFGYQIDEEKIYTQGIEALSPVDFTYAQQLGATIKLLSFAHVKNGVLSTFVAPTLVAQNNPIAHINGVTNAFCIKSDFQFESVLVGQGAGKLPTAHSVISDICAIGKKDKISPFPPVKKLIHDSGVAAKHYVRFQVKNSIGVIRHIGETCEKYGISIHSISQSPVEDETNLPFLLTTERTLRSAIKCMITDIKKEEYCIEEPFFMRIL